MNLRSTSQRGFSALVQELLGTYAFRCQACGHSFQHSVFSLSTVRYAKCPRCFRMDLTTWSESYYRPSFGMRLQMLFGAKRVRCEACRCNFVSFRKRKDTYVRPGSQNASESTTEPLARGQ